MIAKLAIQKDRTQTIYKTTVTAILRDVSQWGNPGKAWGSRCSEQNARGLGITARVEWRIFRYAERYHE